MIDIMNFIYSQEERVIDLEVEITEQIIAHYSLSDQDRDQKSGVEESIQKVSVLEAITAKYFEII
jgi:DNA-binding transcriptional regulator GbsR (MarR family)